jgi:acetoacetate decarboxylase
MTQVSPKTVSGRLVPGRFGASMPVDAPYYQSPPFYYKDAQALTIAYETDPESAANVLPEGIEMAPPVTARLMVVYYPFSTFGPYHEAILGVNCLWQGAPKFYIAHIAVTTVPPLVAGREIWGYPKKLAHIELEQEAEFLRGTVERPAGVRLVTAVARLERPLPAGAGADGGGVLSLRVIPSAEEGEPPALAQLIEVRNTGTQTHEAWSGSATLHYDTASALDPWHCLPVGKVLSAAYTRYDFVLPHGRIVRTY